MNSMFQRRFLVSLKVKLPGCSKLHGKFASKFSTSSENGMYFPWSYERDASQIINTKSVVCKLFKNVAFKSLAFASEEDVIVGAKAAFSASVEHGIFSQFPVRSAESISKFKPSAPVVPDLTCLFEKELATYFEKSIGDIINIENIEMAYQLIETNHCKIVDRKIVVGASRVTMLPPDMCESSSIFGVVTVLDDRNLPVDERGMEHYKDFKTFNKQMQTAFLKGDLVEHYGIEIDCKEIFYVRDTITGEVRQGSLEPQDTTHKITLENHIKYVVDEDADPYITRLAGNEDDWNIVDIDDWLGGNEFWSEYEKEEPQEEEEDEEEKK